MRRGIRTEATSAMEINNSGMNLDEKEAQKEAKRLAREERRRQQEEEALRAKQNMRRKKKGGEQPKFGDKEKRMLMAAIGCAILLIICVKGISYIMSASDSGQGSAYLLLTDITGLTEDDAMDSLREMGFVNIKRSYIYDQFTSDGCVVKTSYHVNSELLPDEEITVYICDRSLIETAAEEDETGESSGSSQSAQQTYFTMDGITVVDMAIKDNVLYAILKNTSSQAIKDIQYRIGYQNADGTDIGENKYNLDSDYTVLPGQKFMITTEIRNTSANYLYISGITCSKISVPDEER